MKIALSETFLEDFSTLQHNLQKKCRDIISSVKGLDSKTLRESSVPGWRVHKLKSSPFISFSLDMNFRMLAKIEGEAIYFHRAVKHSLADSPRFKSSRLINTKIKACAFVQIHQCHKYPQKVG